MWSIRSTENCSARPPFWSERHDLSFLFGICKFIAVTSTQKYLPMVMAIVLAQEFCFASLKNTFWFVGCSLEHRRHHWCQIVESLFAACVSARISDIFRKHRKYTFVLFWLTALPCKNTRAASYTRKQSCGLFHWFTVHDLEVPELQSNY